MLGSTIGGYTITRELGAGGMGTVYLGEKGDERVAVKVVHPHLLEAPGFFKRFIREGDIGRKVVHDNVVRTLDCDAVGGHHYLVMEYVEGRSLRELLDDLGTVPEALLREIARQTAAGLAAIHEVGIVHRDLKPENILITNDNEIRIMDLGVAKLQEASIVLTQEGQFAGSLLYAAPEQFKRDVPVGPASDLYSLGVLLHELATGSNPFRGDDAATVIQAQLNEVPPRAHELSGFLAEVTATLLAKAPAQRFESAAVLSDILGEAERSAWWAEHEPTDAGELPDIRVHRETTLRGRDEELELLRECFGQGQTVWIEGEAGIGKTRLVADFVSGIEDAHVLYGSYPPSGGMGGFSDAVLGKFGSARLAEAVAPYLTATPALVPAFAALVKHEAPAEPLTGAALQATAARLMRALAAEKPVVWIVEDLHFAPQESRDVVLALARAVEDYPILLVVTARPGVAVEDFSRLDNFRKCTLRRLGGRDIVELLAEAFRSNDLAEQLGGKIAVKSDGVPFFVFEMVRGLKEGNFITQQGDGSYVQTQVVDAIEVPSAVKDLIEARLRGLNDEDRDVLDVAAVQGLEFDADLVARVLDSKRVKIMQRLAGIERRTGVVSAEGGGYRFDQNQIQEVLYDAQAPDLRREYHTLLAEANAARGDADDVFLAHHHLRGSEPARAKPHLAPAFKLLTKAYRNEVMVDLVDRALAVDGLFTDEDRVDALLKKAGRLNLLGRRDEQRAVLDAAIELADTTGDPSLRGQARRALGTLLQATAQPDAARDALRAALELAQAASDKDLEARINLTLGNVLHNLGRHTDAIEHFDRARALHGELEDRGGEAYAAMSIGNPLFSMGRHAEARARLESAGDAMREIGDRRGEAVASINIGNVLWSVGQHTEAEERYRHGNALLREIGDRRSEGISAGNLGVVSYSQGRTAEALGYMARYRACSREVGDRRNEANAEMNLGSVLATLGRLTEAKEKYERARTLCRAVGARSEEAHALGGLAAIADIEDDMDTAVRLGEEALALRRELGERQAMADAIVALGDFELSSGRTESATKHLTDGLAMALETESPSTILSATVTAARLPGGDVAAAVAAFEEHGARASHRTQLDCRFHLWELTQDPAHLAAAKELLDDLAAHAPEEDRESMIERIPLHRKIRRAES